MTFGPDESTGARITSLDEYKKHLDHFQSQGYNEIDTARVYVGGKQEAWTADAGYKERGLTIASKWYPSEPGAHKAQKVKEIVNKSLEELRTDKIDIYYLHAGMPEFTFSVLIRDYILTRPPMCNSRPHYSLPRDAQGYQRPPQGGKIRDIRH
jgi:aflatoxin B1 aldehyde reductase